MDRQQRESLGAQIRQAFNDKGWTQEQLAIEADVPLRTISSLMRGERVPQMATVEAVMRALGMEPDPEVVREAWPADVKTFLDIIGLFLVARPVEEREQIMRAITKRIVGTA